MATTSKATTVWSVDKTHSEIGFKVRHLMITNVYGSFSDYKLEASTNNMDFSTARISLTVKVDSVRTGVAARDTHLKSDDFFNAEQFPEITFKSNSFKKTSTYQYELKGDLTIRDITQPIALDVEYTGTAVDPNGQTKAGFSIRGKVKRNDYGLKWNLMTETGNVVVSDEIKIVSEIQMIRQS